MTGVPLKRRASLVTDCTNHGDRPLLTLDVLDPGSGRLADGVEVPVGPVPAAGAATVGPGEVLFGKLRPYLVKSLLVTEQAYASTELLAIRPGCDLEARFLAYLVQSTVFVDWTVATSEGTKMPRTSWEKVGAFCLPDFPRSKQRAIVDFLDTETARIDALITKKRRMIDLLEERFRGEVENRTSDGSSARVRFKTSLITSGPRGWSDLVTDAGDPFVRSANLRRSSIGLRLDDLIRVEPPAASAVEARRSRLAQGDVLVGITGANTGWVGIAGPEVVGGYVSQHVALLRPSGIAPEWLGYSIFSHRSQGLLLGSQYGGTKQQLGLAELAELPVHLPSLEMQATHLAALRALRERTERSETLLATQIALLQEHRQALLTAAITGELAVPGAAA